MPQPPDAPRQPQIETMAQTIYRVVALLVMTAVLVGGVLFAVFGLTNLLAPSPPIATPSLPKTVVVAPSPDARMDAALEQIGRNTAILPTWAAAYAVEQTKTSGDGLATWAADRQMATP